jgi:D-amino-acid oxidase
MDGAEIVGDWSGLRPGRRGGCRLERGEEPDGMGRPVVHCYGHGGAGVTCSWGCANEVVALARVAVGETKTTSSGSGSS